MCQFFMLAVSVKGFGRILTVILPLYGSARKDGVDGLLPNEEPGRDRGIVGVARGECGLYPLADAGLFKSDELDLPLSDIGVFLPDREDIDDGGRISYGVNMWRFAVVKETKKLESRSK